MSEEERASLRQHLAELSLAVRWEARATRTCLFVAAGVTLLACWLMR
jgi:hypothetical protein